MDNRLIVTAYNRPAAVRYAHTWSHSRNPKYLDFSQLGGDCTNFISQCLYAGSGVMNYTPVYGWYYISSSNRTASWTGARFLYKFLTTNKGIGPFASEVSLSELALGDVIHLARKDGHIYHSLIVVQIGSPATYENTLIATHTFDADYNPLSNYTFDQARFLHIEGVRV